MHRDRRHRPAVARRGTPPPLSERRGRTYRNAVQRPSGSPRALFRLAAALGVVTLAANQLGTQLTFTDVTRPAGITFVHHNGAAGDKWYPELFGGGVAVLDIDGDRWPDLLFVNGREWPSTGRGARHGLYRNNRDGTFRDVRPAAASTRRTSTGSAPPSPTTTTTAATTSS